MDSFEASRVLHSRVNKLEPENVTRKIIGYLLVHYGSQEMIRLAFGPDHLIYKVVHKAKVGLGLASKPVPITPSLHSAPTLDLPLQFTPFSPTSSVPFVSPTMIQLPSPYWDSHLTANQEPISNSDFLHLGYSDAVHEDYKLHNQKQFMGLKDQLEPAKLGNLCIQSDFYCAEDAFGNLSVRSSPRPSSLPEFPIKTCHYFNRGFCKHGSSCRYFHGRSFPDGFNQMISPTSTEVNSDDQVFSPRSLEKLELEITELLISRRGNPVSIASLPMLYYEKYGRTLQAEGYLTESQRQGKTGYSLTKLLARLKTSIRVIDRPHGQHSVILAEDAPKYMEDRSERNDPGPIVSGSRQIYLTFPAESTFTEEDVSSYFNTFGPVQDVRIPCQQKRMFGFVTFVSADTVKMILSKGNPHYVCGTRVLVKPYREKSKLIDRKYCEKLESPIFYHSHHMDMDSELQSRWESSRLLGKQLTEEHELALDLEGRRLSELQLSRKSLANQSFIGYPVNELKVSDNFKLSSPEGFNYLLDVLNKGSTSDDNLRHTGTSCIDHESSQGLDLPESPFAASPIGSGISTVT